MCYIAEFLSIFSSFYLCFYLSDLINFSYLLFLLMTFFPEDSMSLFTKKNVNIAQIVGLEGSNYPDLLHPGPGGGKSVGAQLLQQLRRKLSQVVTPFFLE